MVYAEKPFEAFAVGDAASYSKTITEADIDLFAGISGDRYPLHVDAGYAKTTRFGRRVAHGMLSASLFSTVTGLLLGTPGGIYVEQSLKFRRPVFIGDTLTATSTVTSIDPTRRRLHCATTVANQDGTLVLDGVAVLQKDRD